MSEFDEAKKSFDVYTKTLNNVIRCENTTAWYIDCLESKIQNLEKQVALLEKCVKGKPGCKFCVNAHCDCIVLYETETNNTLEELERMRDE